MSMAPAEIDCVAWASPRVQCQTTVSQLKTKTADKAITTDNGGTGQFFSHDCRL